MTWPPTSDGIDGQVGLIGATSTPVGRERLARPVGREDLDAELQQLAREVGDAATVRDREQGSHPVLPPSWRAHGWRAPSIGDERLGPAAAPLRRRLRSPCYPRGPMNSGASSTSLVRSRSGFSPQNFPDLFYPIAIASLVLLIGPVVLYNVQIRRLHRHPPLVALQEWLLWTGLAVFGLLLVYAIFKFYFIFVLVTVVVGLRHVRLDPVRPLPAAHRGLQPPGAAARAR